MADLTDHAQQVPWTTTGCTITTTTGYTIGAMASPLLARIVTAVHNNGLDDQAQDQMRVVA